MEIYDPVVDSAQNAAKPMEEPVTEMEQKVSAARKFVWGWTSKLKVSNGSGQVSGVGFSCVERGELGKIQCQKIGTTWSLIKRLDSKVKLVS